MKSIAVIGAGSMGSGIAQVAAMAGHEVLLYDASPSSTISARKAIQSSLNKLAAKKKITDQDATTIFGRIYFIESFITISQCDLVIEAIVENEEIKKQLFREVESIVNDETIIATNTSSLSITGLASSLKNPHRFIGIHFFNPPVLMKLVEIIPALQTSDRVLKSVQELITSWDKQIVTAKDTPGFIVNRVARPFYGEALRIAEEQLATPQFIDQAMKDIGGFKMGPFELMDFIGNDINEAVTRSVWTAMHFDRRYKPSSLQETIVKAGWYGRKSGRGYYRYDDSTAVNTDNNNEAEKALISATNICERIVAMLINEAADALYLGIASRDDIDTAMTLGVNYPKGLLRWADEKGIDACIARMEELYNYYKDERYRCSAGLKSMSSANIKYYP